MLTGAAQSPEPANSVKPYANLTFTASETGITTSESSLNDATKTLGSK